MQQKKEQPTMELLEEELHELIAAAQIPYSALPAEPADGGQVICFTESVEELTGYTPDEILADRRLWVNMIHPADRERVFAAFGRCKDQGTPFEIEYRVIHKDGSLRYVIDEGEPVFNDKGQVTGVEGTITDVSEYEKARICIYQEKPNVTTFNSANSSVYEGELKCQPQLLKT
jgi:PAS domain S-box-containing protein